MAGWSSIFLLSVAAEQQSSRIFCSSNSDRLNIFCSTNTSMLSSIVVVERHRGVQRSRGGAMAMAMAMASSISSSNYADSLSTREHEGGVFTFFHPETRFQKSVFTGSMRTIEQNDAKHVSLHTKVFPWGAAAGVWEGLDRWRGQCVYLGKLQHPNTCKCGDFHAQISNDSETLAGELVSYRAVCKLELS